jgi:hypothetical protein
MTELNEVLKFMFRQADSCPDNNLTIDELLRWVAHCDEVIDILKTYEPNVKVEVHKSVITNMH